MNLQKIQLSKLSASAQPRPLLTTEVDKLAASIKDVGLIQPITVTAFTQVSGIAEPGWQIIAGHHRVAACRALGWAEIDALVIDDVSHLQSELIEIDENLCRAELTASQRTGYTKRRKQIWEALHPAEIQVGQVVPPEFHHQANRQRVALFALDAAPPKSAYGAWCSGCAGSAKFLALPSRVAASREPSFPLESTLETQLHSRRAIRPVSLGQVLRELCANQSQVFSGRALRGVAARYCLAHYRKHTVPAYFC